MSKLICAFLIIMAPHISMAAPEGQDASVRIKEARQKIAELDSYIHRQYEMMSVQAAMSSQGQDTLVYQRNIYAAKESQRALALEVSAVQEATTVSDETKLKEIRQKISDLDSYIHREYEMMSVKSAMSAPEQEVLNHQRNISTAKENQRALAMQVLAFSGSGISCKKVFN